jgi:hypothetical protein
MDNKNPLTKTEQNLIEKYQKEIREAVLNAVKSVKSCVLFYRDIYNALSEVIKDEETFSEVEGALWLGLHGLKLGDVVLYKIYVDPDDSSNEVVVVGLGWELSEKQLEVLEEVASLFGTEFYDRYDQGGEQFYDAMPLFHSHRTEVYTVLHNLVKLWTGCSDDDE